MDKFEYQAKLEEINKLIEKEGYEGAAKLADTIEWKRVRSVRTLCMISELYETVGRAEDSKAILYRAYRRSPNSRQILYRLTEACVQTQDFDDAVEYYTEYVNLSPNDNSKYILKYEIYKGRGSSLEEQIAVLEELKAREYTEQWAYELAKLYDEAGMVDKCVAECDDLALWFHNGRYVVQALELKKKYRPLTREQQTVYDNPSEIVDMETKEEVVEKAVPTLDKVITRELPKSEKDVIADSIIMDTEKEIAAAVQASDQPAPEKEVSTVDLQSELANNMREILSGIRPATSVEELESAPVMPQPAVHVEDEPEEQVPYQMSIDDLLTGEAKDAPADETAAPAGQEIPEGKSVGAPAAGQGTQAETPAAGQNAQAKAPAAEQNTQAKVPAMEWSAQAVMPAAEQSTQAETPAAGQNAQAKTLAADQNMQVDIPTTEWNVQAKAPAAEQNIQAKAPAVEQIPQVEAPVMREIPQAVPLQFGKRGTPVSGEAAAGQTPQAGAEVVAAGPQDAPAAEKPDVRPEDYTRGIGLDEKEKSMLGFWSQIRGMNEQINGAVLQIMRGVLASKTSSRGNVLLVGDAGNGRTTLAVSLAKIISRCKGQTSVRVAKIYAEDFNKKDIAATVSKMAGGMLIIEEAGDLSDEAVAQLAVAMDFKTDSLVVVLEDERRYLQDLLARNAAFAEKFDVTVNVPMLTNDELVDFGKYYAAANDCALDNSAVDALYENIGVMQSPDQPVAILDVKEIIDKAMKSVNRFGVGRLTSSISGKRYDANDRVILKGKNFKKIK